MMARKSINKHLRVQILRRDGSKCRICGRTSDEVPLEVDHIKPISEGGTDEIENLATLCRDCNLGKSNYKFSDYNSLNLLPDDIEKYFYSSHDDKDGRFNRYHLYCDCKKSSRRGPSDYTYHHEWRITDTQLTCSSDPQKLEQRKIKDETIKFKEIIRRELAKERKRLIVTEDGLIKV